MPAHLAAIYYYPIKGLPGVEISSCIVSAGERLPSDRRYAVGPSDLDFTPDAPRHVRKQELFVLMNTAELAGFSLSYSPTNHRLQLSHSGKTQVDASLDTAAGQTALASCIANLIGAPVKVYSAPDHDHGFTDLSDKTVSLINLASVRALEDALGYKIDRQRFRANFYLDGVPAWSEFDWIDKTVSINGIGMQVYRITDRCAAINVDPTTAERGRLLQDLRKERGNLDMGVYARILDNGSLHVGDPLTLPQGSATPEKI